MMGVMAIQTYTLEATCSSGVMRWGPDTRVGGLNELAAKTTSSWAHVETMMSCTKKRDKNCWYAREREMKYGGGEPGPTHQKDPGLTRSTVRRREARERRWKGVGRVGWLGSHTLLG